MFGRLRAVLISLVILAYYLPSAYALDLKNFTDYDGDGVGDLILYDPSTASFSIRQSSTLTIVSASIATSDPGDVAVLGDFNGDSRADLATFNRSTATFSYEISSSGAESRLSVGQAGDFPVVGDYDGSGCTAFATFNRRTATWTISNCSGDSPTTTEFGEVGDLPFPGDFDCDGKDDLMVFNRPSSRWTFRKSSDSDVQSFFFGLPGDMPFVVDYDGDSCDEVGVYRPSGNFFFFAGSFTNGGVAEVGAIKQWGLPGDLPVLANLDGDRILDSVIYRPSELTFYLLTTANVFFQIPFSATNQTVTRVFQPVSRYPLPYWTAPGDFNGDGRSEFVTSRVNRTAAQTTFFYKYSNGTEGSSTINASGDALVPADYNGDGRTQPAAVFVNTSDTGLYWHILQPSGETTVTQWGLNGDSPIAADFDCDGKADLTVTRNISEFRKDWFFKLTTRDAITDYSYGFQADQAFAGDVNGDGCAEILVAREIAGGLYWFYRNILDGEDTLVQWGLEGDSALAPADMNGDGRDDLIVIREFGGGHLSFQRFGNSSFIMSALGLVDDVPMVGMFSGVGYNELAVYRRNSSATGTFFVKNYTGGLTTSSFGSVNDIIVRPDGSAVQPPSGSGGSGDTGESGGGSTSGCTPSAGTDGDFRDGGGGSLWKPESEGVPNNAPVILLPSSPYCSLYKKDQISISVLDSNGNTVSGVQRSHCNGANDNRVHYWLQKTASQLSSSAPLTVKIGYNGTTECRVVQDPHQRYD